MSTCKIGDGLPAYDWKTVPQGAATSLWAACVAGPDEVGARHCEDCHVAEIDDDVSAKAGVRSHALNPEHAKALWAKGEKMTGEHLEASEVEGNL